MTWWKRKSRFNRAIWRNGLFWLSLIISLALVFYPLYTIIFLGIAIPWAGWYVWQPLRFMFFMPFNANGETHWMLHPRIKRRFRRKYRPGLDSNVAEDFDDIPIEVEQAIQAQVEIEAQDQGSPFGLPIKRMRRLPK